MEQITFIPIDLIMGREFQILEFLFLPIKWLL